MQEWREIIGFPGYSVSNDGFIRNDETDRILRQYPNTRGIAMIGLRYRGQQYKRSVAVLVANAFILTARSIEWTTPINLDGNRFNNHVFNLAWRPLWFAQQYSHQFREFQKNGPRIDTPIENLGTNEVFQNSWEAVLKYGLLDHQLAAAIMNEIYVWPTYHHYAIIE